jgi:pimeloyl-ACP methyl ester carboxylesterase
MSPVRRLFQAFAVVGILAAGHSVLASVLNMFLFHPSSEEAPEIARIGERVTYTSEDGVRLSSWWVPARGERRRTLVYFHGNAATASDLWFWADALADHRTDVLLAEYRGYGQSEGAPSARGIERDAEAAIRYLLDERHVALSELVVQGQSLGGAAAITALAGPASHAAGGVIESTFTSLHDMARVIVGVPLTRLLPDAYALDSASRAPSIHVPILQLHGDGDQVIPFELGERLGTLWPNGEFVRVPRGAHNLADPSVQPRIFAFIDRVAP